MANQPEASPSESTALHIPEVAGISLSLRIPAFWRDRARLWFVSFEAATHDLKKGQRELAQMVIAQLEKQDVEQICDLLYDPPTARQYDVLKERLISVYEESENRQFQKLLSDMELGDQKPSQLLRRMRNLARDKVPDSTLRLMWMNHLPAQVRSVLVVTKETSLDELSLLADKMTELAQEVTAVSCEQPKTQNEPRSDAEHLAEEIRKLSLEVASLKSAQQHTCRCRYRGRGNPSHRSRSRTRSGAYTPSRSRSGTPSPYCYYHRKFGRDARCCRQPQTK